MWISVGMMTRGEEVAASQASSFVCEEWMVMDFPSSGSSPQTTNIVLPRVHGKLQNRPQRSFADAGCNAVIVILSQLVLPRTSCLRFKHAFEVTSHDDKS